MDKRSIAVEAHKPEIKRLLEAAGYNGRRVTVEIRERFAPSNTYWDGGSRYRYVAMRLDGTGAREGARFNPPQFGGPTEVRDVEVPPGAAVVEVAEGYYKSAVIYVNPQSVAPLLPAPVELAADERKVLEVSAAYIPAARREYAGISAEAYDAAKAALIAKGLLNKAGAITVAGRNAR